MVDTSGLLKPVEKLGSLQQSDSARCKPSRASVPMSALGCLAVAMATDLPCLLSKIMLNCLLIHGSVGINCHAEFAAFSAVVAAFLTTPFDVARTRILVDSDGDFSNGMDGGSGDNLFVAMKKISKEGEGGVANLFAGWPERVLHLGIGRAWLEPLQIIGHVGIRDAMLLEWF